MYGGYNNIMQRPISGRNFRGDISKDSRAAASSTNVGHSSADFGKDCLLTLSAVKRTPQLNSHIRYVGIFIMILGNFRMVFTLTP